MHATPELIPITEPHHPTVLALNNQHAVELSWLDHDRLRHLLRNAYYARMTADGAAFLLAFTREADYDSPNFLWFRDRPDSHATLGRFIYIDRIAVTPAARGRGLARALYADLFAQAQRDDFQTLCCEVNIDPPNPASDAFHAAQGFREDGQSLLASGKTVRYLIKPLR
jgi:uncharacterized protein